MGKESSGFYINGYARGFPEQLAVKMAAQGDWDKLFRFGAGGVL
jgi:hypothetical protein